MKNQRRGKKAKYGAEAVAALKATNDAIALLADGKSEDAVKKLEIASGKHRRCQARDEG